MSFIFNRTAPCHCYQHTKLKIPSSLLSSPKFIMVILPWFGLQAVGQWSTGQDLQFLVSSNVKTSNLYGKWIKE